MNTNQIKDVTITAINASDSYDAAIAKLQAAFAGKDETIVRATLLPIVAGHYKLNIGKAKSGPTAGQLAFQLGEKPTDAEKSRRVSAQQKLTRLVNSICCEAAPETAAAKAARIYKAAVAATAKLTPAAKRKLVAALAAELGLKVK